MTQNFKLSLGNMSPELNIMLSALKNCLYIAKRNLTYATYVSRKKVDLKGNIIYITENNPSLII